MPGLKDFPREDWPNAAIVFWSFRVMVGIGFAMLGIGLWSLYLRARGRLADTPLFHGAVLAMGPAGFIAVLAGWITTEVGRQPYTVYGLLRTADSMSPVDAPAVATSLVVFIVVYFIVFGIGTGYLLKSMAKTRTRQRRTGKRNTLAGGRRNPGSGLYERSRNQPAE